MTQCNDSSGPRNYAVRVTLHDGRVGVGAEGELLTRIFRTDESLTLDDVAKLEGLQPDGTWKTAALPGTDRSA